MYVCRGCGGLAVLNETYGIYRCRPCGEAADLAAVEGSRIATVLQQELAAANIRVRMGLRPREFDRQL